MRNPLAKNYRVLGLTPADWQAIKNSIIAYLSAHEDQEEVPEVEVRALHPALANDRVWNEVKKEMGVS